MPPKANTLLSLPPELVKRIVEENSKNELRKPRAAEHPPTGIHPDDPPTMYFQGIGNVDVPQRRVHTPAEQNRIMDDAMTYLNRIYYTGKYDTAPTSKQINDDMKPKAKAKPKERANSVEDPRQVPRPKPKPKPKAKVKAKAKAGY